MVDIVVNGVTIDVPADYSLLQACEAAGAEIPRFCYHERLSVAGNCRMCLVSSPSVGKPIASCALSVGDMRRGPNGEPAEIFTNSPEVKKAREGVMEFLLINHPLDCPICDQGGECDLQDQAVAYGLDGSRFQENKRAVEDKYIGPLVKTIMTRCIHCTRCVRFTTEVAGISELGLIGRGEDAEITTYLESALSSELQGNVVDLCPVGALTSQPYAFLARPWELNKTETIDVMDALGSNIRVDSRGREVMRILPRLNEQINEEWISDKTRYVFDGLKTQRLDQPYVRVRGQLQPSSWSEALDIVAKRLQRSEPHKTGAIAGDLASVEDMFALKSLMVTLGSNNLDCRQTLVGLDNEYGPVSYRFNSEIAGIEEADFVLLVGCDPRFESPVLNARIRKMWLNGQLEVANIGAPRDLTYDVIQLGETTDVLRSVAKGEHEFASRLSHAKKLMIIVGSDALTRTDGKAILAQAARVATKYNAIFQNWNGFNILHHSAAITGGLDIGFVPQKQGLSTQTMIEAAQKNRLEALILLGADELPVSELGDAFVVYIGSHGDVGAHRADVILPGAAYTEKSGIYVNIEGRVQMTQRAVFPPGEAKQDWAILRALAGQLELDLGFDSLPQLREKLYQTHPHLAQIDAIASADMRQLHELVDDSTMLYRASILPLDISFYLTNPIARASKTMAACVSLKAELAEAAA